MSEIVGTGNGTDVIAPVRVYLDASGTAREQRVWAVGGWLGTADQWDHFINAWRVMLDAAPFGPDVKRMFHAADLESLKGTYSGWTDTQKKDFQGVAYGLIGRYSFTAVSSSLIKEDWKAVGPRLSTIADGHPGNYYVHSVADVLSSVRKWADAENYDGPIHYYFEADTIGQGSVIQFLRAACGDPKRRQRARMASCTFAGKEVLPLQAADVWAYEAYKQMLNRIIDGRTRLPRHPFLQLWRERYAPYNGYWDRERLERLLEKATP